MGPLQIGATLSKKYRIERLLAESGGVILYEATDTVRARRVWVKILQREALDKPEALSRFQREAGGAKVLDVGKNDDGLPYMVATELGPSLEKPPRRPPPGAKSAKSTLPGVAPQALFLEDDEPPPSSQIPLLADADVLVEETPPPPKPERTPAQAIEPEPDPTPALPAGSLFASPFSSPLTAPPAPEEPVADDPADEEVTLEETSSESPAKKRGLEATSPSIRIADLLRDEKRRRRAAAWRWTIALPLVASLAGVGGWYIGRHEAEGGVRVEPAPTAPAAPLASAPETPTPADTTATTTSTATATPTRAETAPTTPSAVASAPAAHAAPTVLTEPNEPAAPTAPVMLTSSPKPAPTHAKPAHPRPRRPHRKPVTSGDPLTL